MDPASALEKRARNRTPLGKKLLTSRAPEGFNSSLGWILRVRAGLKDARIHDLRHTFASAAVAAGQGLPIIGRLLAHTQVATTARYAHLAADPVKVAADQVSLAIAKSIFSDENEKAAVNE